MTVSRRLATIRARQIEKNTSGGRGRQKPRGLSFSLMDLLIVQLFGSVSLSTHIENTNVFKMHLRYLSGDTALFSRCATAAEY